jgi:hypothetical protein
MLPCFEGNQIGSDDDDARRTGAAALARTRRASVVRRAVRATAGVIRLLRTEKTGGRIWRVTARVRDALLRDG